jgi:hypothetical protein
MNRQIQYYQNTQIQLQSQINQHGEVLKQKNVQVQDLQNKQIDFFKQIHETN